MTETPIRVVLADDHAVVRAGIRQYLESAPDISVVAEAADGEAAVAAIERLGPDVVVLDIQMPGMSGIEVTQWVRSHRPATGVLILTAFDDDPFIMAVLQAGANGYVLKTATAHEIVEAVREVHEGKSVLDPAIAQKLMARIADSPIGAPVDRLTDREIEVLRSAGRGLTNKAIAVQLRISDRTVQGHLARVFEKLHAASRTEAVMRAVSLGWLPAQLGRLEGE